MVTETLKIMISFIRCAVAFDNCWNTAFCGSQAGKSESGKYLWNMCTLVT